MTKAQRQLLFDMQATLKDAGRWNSDLEERFRSAVEATRSPEMRVRLSGKQPLLIEE